MIIQSDTLSGKPEGCNGIKETGSQTSETAVSERRLRLHLLYRGKLFAVFLKNLLQIFVNPQIDQVVGQKLTDQELRRDIINLLLALDPFRRFHQLLGKLQNAVIQLLVAAGGNGFAVSALCLALHLLLQIHYQYVSFQVTCLCHVLKPPFPFSSCLFIPVTFHIRARHLLHGVGVGAKMPAFGILCASVVAIHTKLL